MQNVKRACRAAPHNRPKPVMLWECQLLFPHDVLSASEWRSPAPVLFFLNLAELMAVNCTFQSVCHARIHGLFLLNRCCCGQRVFLP